MKQYTKRAAIGLLSAAVVCGGIFATSKVLPLNKQNTKLEVVKNTDKVAETGITVHYRWEGDDTPHIYYENVDGDGQKVISFPGIPMNNTKDGWYSYTIDDVKSADLRFTIGDSYTTAFMNRTAGEWWFDQDAWYAYNPDGEKDESIQLADKKTIQKISTKTVDDGDGKYSKDKVTTTSKDGTTTVGLEKIDNVNEYIDTYVVKQDLAAAKDADIIIHYYAENSEVPSIYFWNGMPADVQTVWPGQPMTLEGDNWYQYTFKGVDKVNFLFTSGLTQTEDMTQKKGEWWYKDGKWTQKKPTAYEEKEQPIKTVTSDSYDFREETIYFLMTTRFYNGDTSNDVHCWDEGKGNEDDPAWRGDFKGLIEKMDYVKALGFSAIWITPVVENCSGLDYHGYHAMNFQKVDERYLSDGVSYQTVINAAHEKGLKIIQDVVFNHTGNFGETTLMPMFEKSGNEKDYGDINKTLIRIPQSEGGLLLDSYDEQGNMKDDAFATYQYEMRLALMKDTKDPVVIKNGKKVRNDPKTFYHRYDKTFSWDYYTAQLGQIGGDCVDLNTENPIVAKYITDSYSKYIDMGVDAFRIDTVKHISRLTFNNFFNPVFKAVGGEKFYMFGEVCTKSAQVWYRGETPPLSAPFYTWKDSKDYDWKYYDKDVVAQYDAYASTEPEKVRSNFDQELEYDNWRLDNEGKLGLAHAINMASAEQNYNDNANDICGQNNGQAISAQAKQPVSTNAFLNENEYHTPDTSMASGLNTIDFTMHWNFANALKAFESVTGGYNYEAGKVSDNLSAGGDYCYNDCTWNVTYVDSHDYGPDGGKYEYRYDGGTEAWAENMNLLFTFRGIPCIYYGSEIEFQAGLKIDPAGGDKIFKNSGRAYYGDYLEGDIKASDYGEYTASGAVKETLEKPLCKQLIRLNKIRRAIPALQKGQYNLADITKGKGGIAFKRRYTSKETDSYVLVAITGSAEFSNVLNGTYHEAITGETVKVTDGKLSVKAPGKGNMRVYVLDTELTKAPGKIGDDTSFLK
jgi:glycosidase